MITIFGVQAQALNLHAQRARLLGSNLINADTPNFKARDFDFQAALRKAQSGSGVHLRTTRSGHIQAGGNGMLAPDVRYRVPEQASLDGNTVNGQREMVEFSRNAMQYQASLRFLNGKIKGLLTAIRGD